MASGTGVSGGSVAHGGAGRANANLVHVVGAYLRVSVENFLKRVDRCVIAAATRIRLAADVESLKALSQILSQVRQIGMVTEGRAKAAVGGKLRDVVD